MHTGMLWFNNDTKIELKKKIEEANVYYQGKYHAPPNFCFVHPSMFTDNVEIPGIEIRKSRLVLPGYIWIGFDEDKA